MFRFGLMGAVAALALSATPTSAEVFFNNGTTANGAWGHASTAYDHVFDGWIAQDFNLAQTSTLTGGQLFMSILYGYDEPESGVAVELTPPTGLYFEILAYGADPTEDPQGVVASGQGTLQALTPADCTHPAVDVAKCSPTFTLPSVVLGAGDYFFSLKLIAPIGNTYLDTGANYTNARITLDHGATWTTNTRNGLALRLTGDVGSPAAPAPEPSTWALMLLGFGTAGAMLRRRHSNPMLIALRSR